MAEPVTIARPYAEAVFKLAREKNDLAGWSRVLAELETLVNDPQMQTCIGDPNVSAQQLEALILGIAGESVDGAGRNFVQVLIGNDRLTLLPEIRALYEELRREHEGILEARVISAFPIDEQQLAQLVAKLEAKYRRKISAQVEVDPQLIGGVQIIIGDQVIDATVRGQLDAMAAALTH
ncbi:MAG TPA: F0F1 ATP synthase subunit delta [Burkholderiales bacterium]|nr:F0F1 ATP synthase subunit delta [Burkholderiales bacterium]